jgi:flagellar biosynthesis chaperone FliJ
MQSIQQVQMIHNALQSERKRFLAELGKVNRYLNKRLGTIEKILSYQHEYSDTNNLKMSRAVPTLHQNLELFSKKIAKLVQNEEFEVKKLENIKESIIDKITNLDQKIKLMANFRDKALMNELLTSDKWEQTMLDDLSVSRRYRTLND